MKKKASLIIGAAGGVGLEVVKLLLAQGRTVFGSVLHEREAARLRTYAPGIDGIVTLDLATCEAAKSLLSAYLRSHVPVLDEVVICAAISPYGPLETSSLDTLRRVLEINMISTVAIYQATLPFLRQSKGRLVCMSSIAGKVAMPFVGYYCISKFALEAAADVMRREAAPFGVRVSVIEPGGIKTPMVLDQRLTIERDRREAPADTRRLYDGLYASYSKYINEGFEGAQDAATVAQVILNALDMQNAPTRVPVGTDAEYFCESAAQLSDEQIDAIVAGFLPNPYRESEP